MAQEPEQGAQIRPASEDELAALSDLCLRSKAHWGYDHDFLEACRDELTLTVAELETAPVGVIDDATGPVALGQYKVENDIAQVEKLFVDPGAMGQGHGRHLFDWIVRQTRAMGARRLLIEADPQAAGFYRQMGAVETGSVPSGSIPGRCLPLLAFDLACPANPRYTPAVDKAE